MWGLRSQWNSAQIAIEKTKILGAVLELPAKQQCQSSPFTSNWAKLAKLAVLYSYKALIF